MNNGFRLGAPDIAYIGAGVTVKGAIVVYDAIIVDGVVESDATAQSIRIGQSGAIKGKLSNRCRRVFSLRRPTSKSSCSSAQAPQSARQGFLQQTTHCL